MVNISFQVQGEKQLSRRIMANVRKLENMQDFHEKAIDIVSKRSDAIFDSDGAVLKKSPKWKPLAPSTHRARKNRWGYYKNPKGKTGTLQWTWALRDNRDIQISKQMWSMEFTTDYAKYHAKWGWNLPKRAIIDLDSQTNTDIVKALHQHIYDTQGVFGRQTT